ncbi:hypothetical protein KVV02_008177 [Mortierella alpina]|uniref:SMP-LTD domain-containing protein n=1 Tax=Mortierella alpina TaxID=64518 RepID=A0A9P8CUX2_MORAP|nr:hypothetical protein KVV02_008177 [Mortierella alpina]
MAPLVNAKEWFKKRQSKKKTSADNSNNSSNISETYAATADTSTTNTSVQKSTGSLQTQTPPLATALLAPANISETTIAPRFAPETTYVPRTQYISSKDLRKDEQPSTASASSPYLPYPTHPTQTISSLPVEMRNGSHTSLPTRFRLSDDFKKELKNSYQSQQQHISFQPTTKQKPQYHSLQNQLPPTQPRPQLKDVLKPMQEKRKSDLKRESDKTIDPSAALHDLTAKAFAEYQAAKIFKGLSAKFRTSSETLRDAESVAQEYARTIKGLWQMVEDEELSQRMADASPEEREKIIVHHNTSRELPFHGLDLTAAVARLSEKTLVQSEQAAANQQVPSTPTTRHATHRGSHESSRSDSSSLRRRSAQSGGSYRHKDSHYLPYNSQHHHHHHHNNLLKTHDPRLSAIRESGYQTEEIESQHLYQCPPAPRSSLQESRIPLHHRNCLADIQQGVPQRFPDVDEMSETASVEDLAVSSTLVSETDDHGEQFSELASTYPDEDEEEFCKRFRLGEDEDDDDIELESDRFGQEVDFVGLPPLNGYGYGYGYNNGHYDKELPAIIGQAHRFDVREATSMMLVDPRTGFHHHDIDMISARSQQTTHGTEAPPTYPSPILHKPYSTILVSAGGVTFIPLTLLVTVAVLWIRLPPLDSSQPRPTDLPPPTIVQEIHENPRLKTDGSTRTGATTAGGSSHPGSVRPKKSDTKKPRPRSDQHSMARTLSPSSASIASGVSSATATTAPARLRTRVTQDGSDEETDLSDSEDDQRTMSEGETVATHNPRTVAAREPDVLMQSDPNLNKEGYVRMTRVPRLGPAAESISDYMSNMLFQPKNARPKDSYYAVLRYDTLFLYESDQQRDCKSVVPMNLYEVKIFPKNLPDNEVFNKEHPIQIKRKSDAPASASILDNGQDEYYIFIHTPVVKEDWYLALLYASKLRKPGTKQKIQDKAQFDPEAILNHIRTLHSDKHHENTRWFNSFLGRIFLGIYKTKKIQDIFIQKITRKTLKLKRPSFLGEIKVRSFNVGHSIPYITRTKLHELAVNGELTAEFHLAYQGGVRVEIEVDVGVKSMKVTVVLAVLVKSISGTMTLKIKAPPTNRFWIGFQEPPDMDIVIEPIVADKAIKLNMVLGAIESKIREAMVEAIVLPNMDDYPFFDSRGAGGIFEGDEEIEPEHVDDSDAESMMTGKSVGGKAAKGRRGSESSLNSDLGPQTAGKMDRKMSWSSTGTDSDVDPESAHLSTTPPSPSPPKMYLHQHYNGSSGNTSTASTPIAATMAAKFKRFSQAHFPSRSSESLVEATKLNTKPTVATSIATAIRTSPAGTPPHSNNSSGVGVGGVGGGNNPSKMPSVIPKLSALSESAETPQGPRIFGSSPSNGPSKKASSSSMRRLASLESPASNDSESSDNAEDNWSKDGEGKGGAESNGSNGGMSSSSTHIGIAGILEGNPRSSSSAVSGNLASLFSSDRRNKKGHDRSGSNGAVQQGTSKESDPPFKGSNGTGSVKDHGRKNSGDSLMSLRMKKDLLLKKISSNSSNDEDQEPGSGNGISSSRGSSLSGLLGHRRKGSLTVGGSNSNNNNKASSNQGQELMQRSSLGQVDSSDRPQSSWGQEPLPRGLERSKPSTSSGAQAKREVDLYPLGRPFETNRDSSQLPPTAPMNSSLTSALGTTTTTTTPGAAPGAGARPSLSPSGSSGASSLASSSSSSSRSAFLQQKSQAALGATKAWVKRSLEDRRVSEEDPLLSGKMRMD